MRERPDRARRGCAAAAGGRWAGGTGPRSRPRGRGRRARRAGAARTPRCRQLALAQRAARSSASVPIETSGARLVDARAHARAVRGAADLPGVADVAQADVVGRVEAGLGAEVAVRQRPERLARRREPPSLGVPSRHGGDPTRGSAGRVRARPAIPLLRDRCAHDLVCTTRRTAAPLRRAGARASRRHGSGIYACGPTVYGRIHVGNARPFVVFCLLKRFLEHEGYDVDARRQRHRRQRQDLRRRARAPGVAERRAGARDDRAYVADTDGSGSAAPTTSRWPRRRSRRSSS